MTTKELAYQIEPRVKLLLENMVPAIKQAAGPLKWTAIVLSFGVTWKVITSHQVLPTVIQHALEYGIGETKRFVDPIIASAQNFIPLLEEFITDKTKLAEIKQYFQEVKDLYTVSVGELLPAVQSSLENTYSSEAQSVLVEINFSSIG